ncbi:energy-coupling factor transporter transmembrane protein EcfT, partial [Paenibacillus chitinolyticus]
GARRGHGANADAGLSAPEERAAQAESAAASAHASVCAGSASREAMLCGSVGASAASGSQAAAAGAGSAGPFECGRGVTPAIEDDSSAAETVQAGTSDRTPEEVRSPESGTQPASAASGTSAPAAAPRPRALTVGRLFDPRTFWIGYVLLSAGILLQHSLIGLAVSAALTAAAVLLSQVPFRAVWKPLRAFLIFTGLSAVIAGLTLGAGQGGSPVGFDPHAALSAVRALSNLMLVLVLGVLFPLTVGYLRMKQGVEQGLAFLGKLKFPVEAIALTASLMFRFIPLIGGQWNRFGRIAKARGQGRSGKSGLGLAEFRIMALPFMFSLIRMADEFSTALEIRGYSRTGGRRTRSLTLRMKARDYAAMGVFLLVFLCLAALAGILG